MGKQALITSINLKKSEVKVSKHQVSGNIVLSFEIIDELNGIIDQDDVLTKIFQGDIILKSYSKI